MVSFCLNFNGISPNSACSAATGEIPIAPQHIHRACARNIDLFTVTILGYFYQVVPSAVIGETVLVH